MTALSPVSERAIILAPLGRDGSLALAMLNEAGYTGMIASNLTMLCDALEEGAGLLVIAAEALRGVDLEPLLEHLHQDGLIDLSERFLCVLPAGRQRVEALCALFDRAGSAVPPCSNDETIDHESV